MYSNSIAYGLKVNTSTFIFNPVSINTATNTYLDLLLNENYKVVNYKGKGYIDKINNQYINLVSKNNQLGILKYNILSNTSEFIPATTNITNYNINTVIIE